MARKPPEMPPDSALWQHVLKSVKPHPPRLKNKVGRDVAPLKPAAAAKTAKNSPASAPAAPPKEPPRPKTVKSAPPAPRKGGFDRATETKFRRGALDIDGRLDLHGMTQARAHAALLRFIRRHHGEGARTLLVITGKGRVSEGGGVLRRLLPLWLEEGDMADCVLALAPAQAKDGGTGAFYVRLRRQR